VRSSSSHHNSLAIKYFVSPAHTLSLRQQLVFAPAEYKLGDAALLHHGGREVISAGHRHG